MNPSNLPTQNRPYQVPYFRITAFRRSFLTIDILGISTVNQSFLSSGFSFHLHLHFNMFFFIVPFIASSFQKDDCSEIIVK